MTDNREETESPTVTVPVKKSRNVLLAVDGSKGCKKAFDWYLENMWRSSDLVLLVHVFNPPTLPSYSFSTPGTGLVVPAAYQQLVEEAQKQAREIIDGYETVLKSSKVPYRTIVHSGDTGETICAIAEVENADAIVVGCRGLGVIRRTFLGSVSDYVLHHVHIPVTVVPGKQK